MTRLALVLLLALAGAACGDEADDLGPGRPNYPAAPACQWKTPCPEAQPAQPTPDGGIADGGLPR